MLIVVSAVVSTVALLGALIVGYSTSKSIAGLPPKRDAGAVLTAFPADVERQISQQQAHSAGVATVQQPALTDTARQLADSLRSNLAQAAGQVTLDAQQPAEQPSLTAITAELEQALLDQCNLETGNIEAVREYALRQLSSTDGTVVLPRFSTEHLSELSEFSAVATQLSQLQQDLNQQIAGLPELQDRTVIEQDIRVESLEQLHSAVEALDLQSDLLGLEFNSGVRYESLKNLGEQLLGGNASLEGLDMSELEAVSRDIVSQLSGDFEADLD